MTDITIGLNRHRAILRSKLILWQNTYIDAKYDTTIAEAIDDTEMKNRALAMMKRSLKAISFIENELTVLEQANNSDETIKQ